MVHGFYMLTILRSRQSPPRTEMGKICYEHAAYEFTVLISYFKGQIIISCVVLVKNDNGLRGVLQGCAWVKPSTHRCWISGIDAELDVSAAALFMLSGVFMRALMRVCSG